MHSHFSYAVKIYLYEHFPGRQISHGVP